MPKSMLQGFGFTGVLGSKRTGCETIFLAPLWSQKTSQTG